MVSSNGDWDPTPQPVDRRQLSFYLAKLCKVSDAATAPHHMPFFTGTGWPNGGANKEVADALLDAMGLEMKIMGVNTNGRVIDQFPDPGTALAGSTHEVAVLLDGTTVDRRGRTAGDPILIDVASNDHPLQELVMTTDLDDQDGDCEKTPSVYLFWRLPDQAKGKQITARIMGRGGPRVALTAWETPDLTAPPTYKKCRKNRHPRLRFRADATKLTLLSVDIPEHWLQNRGPELVTLRVRWQ